MFCKIVAPKKFCKIYRKTLVLKSLYNKVAGPSLGLQLCRKETPAQVFYFKFCEIFKNTYFVEHLRGAAFWNFLVDFVNGYLRILRSSYICG